MIYNSYDIIPIKLFLRIEQTEEYNLLTDEKFSTEQLSLVWENIKKQREELGSDTKESKKILKLSKKLEVLKVKHRITILCIYHLQSKKDTELEGILKGYGYKLSDETFDEDLERIEKQNKIILFQIEQVMSELPQKETGGGTLDELILSYSGLLGMGFIDTNTITGTQFDALIKAGNKKLKQLEKNGK